MRILKPALERRDQEPAYLGGIVMGTIEGDIHDIGKNIVASLLQVAGFKVIDLGKDVPLEEFTKAARKENTDISGVSALPTTTMRRQRELLEILTDSGIRNRIRVMIGGAPSSEARARETGADGYAPDAAEAASLVKQLISSGQSTGKGAVSRRE